MVLWRKRWSGAKLPLTGVPLLPNIIQFLYKNFLQPAFFKMDPEKAHNLAIWGMKTAASIPGFPWVLEKNLKVENSRLHVQMGGLEFLNPVGLAAGFDKNAELLKMWPRLGFGFTEMGTLTPLPQKGNARPRLFRYPREKAIVNQMGFNNCGLDAAVKQFVAAGNIGIPLGINIGKQKDTPVDRAMNDYEILFEGVYPFADYIVINVSSPNTPKLRELQSKNSLKELVGGLDIRNARLGEKYGRIKTPLFIKLAPDLTENELADITETALEFKCGLVATNTTTSRFQIPGAPAAGGLSGKPLKPKSDEILASIYRQTRGRVPLIGVGGIFSAEDAYDKIRKGASLVQVYTGWIYEGPGLIPQINKGLLDLLDKDGFKSISDAVGTGV